MLIKYHFLPFFRILGMNYQIVVRISIVTITLSLWTGSMIGPLQNPDADDINLGAG